MFSGPLGPKRPGRPPMFLASVKRKCGKSNCIEKSKLSDHKRGYSLTKAKPGMKHQEGCTDVVTTMPGSYGF